MQLTALRAAADRPQTLARRIDVPAHSVTLQIPVGRSADASAFTDLEDALAKALRAAKAGTVDGNEIGDRLWTIFMHGKSADGLFEAIRPALKASSLSVGATVTKQFGGPNAEERKRVLWAGRFRITQRARKPGRRPRVGDLLEFDCKGGVGMGHAVHRETSVGMRGLWVVALLCGVRKSGESPDLTQEVCRIWLPLGGAVSQGLMRIVGSHAPTSDEMPPYVMSVSFDFVRACVEHGRSLYDDEFVDSLFEQES